MPLFQQNRQQSKKFKEKVSMAGKDIGEVKGTF